jgi:hypothetical protein
MSTTRGAGAHLRCVLVGLAKVDAVVRQLWSSVDDVYILIILHA